MGNYAPIPIIKDTLTQLIQDHLDAQGYLTSYIQDVREIIVRVGPRYEINSWIKLYPNISGKGNHIALIPNHYDKRTVREPTIKLNLNDPNLLNTIDKHIKILAKKQLNAPRYP